ncbi:MAG TPA: carboxypeptidase regulatory-like domain-containing protein [bacterium]|nr:carboxypeptidase regulatory-like domain-containing protein [bacterium]
MKTSRKVALFLLLAGSLWLAENLRADTISFQVDRSDGQPVAGARLTVTRLHAKETAAATTDRTGRAEAAVSGPGYYRIRAEAAGYLAENLRSLEINQAKYGEVIQRLTLRRPGSISGFVYDKSGRPLAGGRVNNTPCDGRGFYLLKNLSPGPAYLNAQAPGFVRQYRESVPVKEGEETGGVNFNLEPGGRLSGRVIAAETGRPIARAWVNTEGPTYLSAQTDSDGNLLLDGLAAGTYKISVYTQGYREGSAANLEVRPGQTTRLPGEIRLQLRPKSFSLNRRNYIFQPGESVQIRYNAFRVTKLRLELYPFNPRAEAEKILGQQLNPHTLEWMIRQADLSGRPPAASLLFTVRYPQPLSDLYDRSVTLKSLPAGLYLVRLTSPEEVPDRPGGEDRFYCLVTDLALVRKSAPEQNLLFACGLADGRPRPETLIWTLGGPGAPRLLGRTDASGRLETNGGGLALAEAGTSLALLNLPTARPSNVRSDPTIAYLYTERPVYRPGQTVYFKGFLRLDHGNRYEVPPARKARVQVRDPEDRLVSDTWLPVSENGSLAGSLELAAEPRLGNYTLSIHPDQAIAASGTSGFQVLEYRKPEYQVEVEADRDRYLPGEKIRFRLRASYYFGQPVANARVNYLVYERSGWWADYDYEEYENENGGPGWGYGKLLRQGEAQTGPDGTCLVELPGRGAYENETRFTLEARVVDRSQREVIGRASADAVPGAFRIGLVTPRYVYYPGEAVPLEITVRTWDDRPVAGLPIKVFVALERYEKNRYTWTELQAETAVTGPEGRTSLNLKPGRSGYLKVYAQASDEYKNLVNGLRYIWVAGREYTSAWSSSRELEIVTDQKSYRPGDTARVLITTAFPGQPILLTVEGTRLHESRILQPEAQTSLLEFPVTAEHIPNFTLGLTAVRNRELHQAERTLPVVEPNRFLTVEITPDRKEYRPGEISRFAIRTLDSAGAGTPAEVSLGLVDKAIYAIAPETTLDPDRFFYGRKPNRVSTGYSFYTWEYGGAKDLAETGLRRNFKDTAFWIPALWTDREGRASLEVALPDNLTTWRATARAVTPETRVGGARREILVSKPLLARLAAPRFLVEGDRFTLSAVIHNYTGADQPVTVILEARGLRLLETAPQEATIPAGGSIRCQWLAVAGEAPEAELALRAGNRDYSDGLETKIPVLPYATAVLEVRSGECRESALNSFKLPAAAASPKLTSYLYPSLASGLFRSLDYLAGYPYGCVEQTLNRFLPTLQVARAVRELGVSDLRLLSDDPKAFQKMLEELPAMVNRGLARLYDYQHADGGWGWWAADASHPYTSALVLYGLTLTEECGYPVDPEVRRRAVSFLAEQVKSLEDPDARAYAAFSLSQAEPAVPSGLKGTLAKLFQERSRLNPYGRALLALSFHKADPAGRVAAQVAEELLADLKPLTPDISFWKADRPDRYSWVDSDVEASAWALKAVLALAPQSPEIPKIIRYLVASRRLGRWRSTKDTAVCVSALTDFLRRGTELNPDFTAELTVNNQPLAREKFDRDSLREFVRIITAPPGTLKAGEENTLSLKKTGAGNLYYSHALDYLDRSRLQEPEDRGFTVKREYRRLQAGAGDAAGNPEEKPFAAGDTLKVGERVRVTLTITGRDFYEFAVIEDALPSGFEVVETPENEAGGNWYCRREVHDERIVFFTPFWGLDAEGKGTRTLVYHLRPETTGDFQVRPARASLMYFPEVNGRSDGFHLRVREE